VGIVPVAWVYTNWPFLRKNDFLVVPALRATRDEGSGLSSILRLYRFEGLIFFFCRFGIAIALLESTKEDHGFGPCFVLTECIEPV
jgi:hypothetical protein